MTHSVKAYNISQYNLRFHHHSCHFGCTLEQCIRTIFSSSSLMLSHIYAKSKAYTSYVQMIRKSQLQPNLVHLAGYLGLKCEKLPQVHKSIQLLQKSLEKKLQTKVKSVIAGHSRTRVWSNPSEGNILSMAKNLAQHLSALHH